MNYTIDYDLMSDNERSRLAEFTKAAYSTAQGVQQTYLLAQGVLARQIPGDFVECGVGAGAQVAAMALALEGIFGDGLRKIHLFDSFEGIPMAGPHDQDQPGIGHHIADVNLPLKERLRSSGVTVHSRMEVLKNLVYWGFVQGDLTCPPFSRFISHQGWFQDTIPRWLPQAISFLRLDGDLYESTLCCLQGLYQHVSKGGVVLLDDYPLVGSRKAFEDYFDDMEIKAPEVTVNVDTGAAYWVKDE